MNERQLGAPPRPIRRSFISDVRRWATPTANASASHVAFALIPAEMGLASSIRLRTPSAAPATTAMRVIQPDARQRVWPFCQEEKGILRDRRAPGRPDNRRSK